jgi:prepilin-type processing-associated H-X9-DG protein
MGISLLSPLYLFGLAFLAVPLAIHLFSRRTVKEREFSDIRFIREAITRRQKEIELEDRRLLILRLALIALLALALAKPVIKTSETAVARSGEKTSLVFVVDDSFSMATSDNGVVRMDRATAKIRSLLSFFGTGDEVSLIAASERPRVLLKRTPAGAGEVSLALEGLQPSYLTSDLAAGLRLATSILGEVEEKKREIYLVTDMQALAWEKVDFRREDQGKLDIDLFVVDVGMTGQRNLAITDVKIGSEEESGGENRSKVHVTFQVQSYGPGTDQTAILREVLAGREGASVAIRPRADQPVEQTFSNWVREKGPVIGYGELGHDPLTADNRRFFVHGGGGRRNVLFLDGNPVGGAATENRPEGFFLRKALEALKDDLSLNLREQRVTGEMDRADFAAYHAVIFVDVATLTARCALALRRYVEDGGRAILFLGPHVQPSDYNTLLYPDLLPLAMAPNPRLPHEPVSIDQRLPDHPLFDMFNQENIDFSEAGFRSHWDLDEENGSEARPLAWYSDDGIAIAERQLGTGKVLLFTFSPGPPWSDLPKHLVFVPFIGEMMSYLLPADAEKTSFHVGEAVTLQVLAGDGEWEETVSIRVNHPSGEAETLSAALGVGSGNVYFDNLKEPGVYRFGWGGTGSEGSVSPQAVAANPNTAESDLTTIETSDAVAKLTAFRTNALKSRALEAGVSQARKGRPVWDYLLLVMVGLLVAETVYGNRLRRPDHVRK